MQDITPKELKARLDAGEDIDIIDVREDWEVAKGMLAEAVHIPMNDIPDMLDQIPTDKPVVIMCHLGSRSSQVVAFLEAQGYENLMSLDGGIARWSKDVDPSIPG
jgi:rhodanese-related sulfurtransferase